MVSITGYPLKLPAHDCGWLRASSTEVHIRIRHLPIPSCQMHHDLFGYREVSYRSLSSCLDRRPLIVRSLLICTYPILWAYGRAAVVAVSSDTSLHAHPKIDSYLSSPNLHYHYDNVELAYKKPRTKACLLLVIKSSNAHSVCTVHSVLIDSWRAFGHWQWTSPFHAWPNNYFSLVILGTCSFKEAARVVFNSCQAPMPLVFSPTAHIDKEEGYSSSRSNRLQRLNRI